jgi:hypothetical protein
MLLVVFIYTVIITFINNITIDNNNNNNSNNNNTDIDLYVDSNKDTNCYIHRVMYMFTLFVVLAIFIVVRCGTFRTLDSNHSIINRYLSIYLSI